MFGFIKPCVPELKVREHELYRAVYCGLCSCMGRTTLLRSRLTLSYDAVFLALVRIALTGERISITPRRCPVHPFRRRPTADPSLQLEYCARVSALLSYYNIKDKINDGKGIKKLLYRIALLILSPSRRKASLPEAERVITESLAALTALESSGCPSPDAAAQTFGDMLAALCSAGLENHSDLAREAGLHTGRFIYLADAAQDYESDLRSGSYNPFICAGADPRKPDEAERIFRALTLESAGVYAAVALAEPIQRDVGGLCENISRLGLSEVADNICHGNKKIKGKSDEQRPL